jgi:alkanesulfonate monooxygenase SsuD/methylene tetrahydromethanopterin reductase-like flavin-dependent oxidoreductase (luciferase family)
MNQSKGRSMSTRKPEFGFTVPQRASLFGVQSLADMVQLAAKADASGAFTSMWVGDSILAKPRPESLTLLGSLAAVTTRVRLGVGCMASFPIRHPLVFAHQWATLDQLSRGRMDLAVCTGLVKERGASEFEGTFFGVTDRQRVANLEENVAIIRALWSRDFSALPESAEEYRGVALDPSPIQQPPPVWIAANSVPGRFYEQSLRRIATLADGWMTVQHQPDRIAGLWRDLKAMLLEEGRDPERFPTLAYHNINVNPDRAAALAESKKFLDEYYGPVFSEKAVEAWTASGTPEQCAEQLVGLYNDGTKNITLRITSWDQVNQLQRVIHEVLPLTQ